MTPQRYARLRESFLKVLDLPRLEQESVLERDCKDDPKLRDQIEALLAIDRAMSGSDRIDLPEQPNRIHTIRPVPQLPDGGLFDI